MLNVLDVVFVRCVNGDIIESIIELFGCYSPCISLVTVAYMAIEIACVTGELHTPYRGRSNRQLTIKLLAFGNKLVLLAFSSI